MPQIEGEVKVKDKKVRAIFVGQDVDLKDLCKSGPVPIQFPEPHIPEFRAGYGTVYKQKVPRLLVAYGLEPHGYGGAMFVKCLDHKTGAQVRVALPTAAKVHVLTGRQGKAMMTKTSELMAKSYTSLFQRVSLQMGTDPEFFVETPDGVLPAFEFLPRKADAANVTVARNTGALYWDGFQAEFTLSANTCLGYMSDGLQASLKRLHLAAKTKNKDARISTATVVEIPDEVLKAAKPEHVEFGCAPSLNIYGLIPEGGLDGRSTSARFAGGHIHFGHALAKAHTEQTVRCLDAILGVACVSLFEGMDNPVRRKYYGLPGEYRLPPHGLEYRTLSNAWLCHPLMFNVVYEIARLAYSAGVSGLRSFWDATDDEVITCIREADVDMARAMMLRNEAKYMDLFKRVVVFGANGVGLGAMDTRALVFQTLMSGAAKVLKNPHDLAGNWQLDSAQHGVWKEHGDGEGKNWTHARDLLAQRERV